MSRMIVAAFALAAVAVAAWRIEGPSRGLEVTQLAAGTTPVTLFAPRDSTPSPAVVVAHGFAGSRPLMHPFAVTLAAAGYRAFVFDFPGHGANPEPLAGSLTAETGATDTLVASTLDVIRLARSLLEVTGGVALLGHSMASDIVVRAAQRDGGVVATVAVSMFSPAVTADAPGNLLVLVGAWEPATLREEGVRVLAQVAGSEAAVPGRTVGSFSRGNARRLEIVGGVEHISILYAEASLVAAREWLNDAFGRNGEGPVDRRGPWLALATLGLVVLAWPLAALLPRAATRPAGAALPWRTLWPAIALPALATPLMLAMVPTDFLPVLVGDYVAAHFALYGVLTWLVLLAQRRGNATPVRDAGTGLWAVLAGGVGVAAYAVLAVGGALDRWFASFWPTPERVPLVLAMLVGTLPFFLALEWVVRGRAPARGGHVVAKAAFLGSLGLAVALDLEGLFFLVIIVPAIVVFFFVFGLFAHWAYARTWHPAVGAVGNAVALAWALAVTFPIIGG